MDNPLYIAVTKEYLPLTRNGDRLARVTDTVATVKVSDNWSNTRWLRESGRGQNWNEHLVEATTRGFWDVKG